MKKNTFLFGIFLVGISMFLSCEPKENTSNNPKKIAFPYTLEISEVENSKAPALQSFAHGVSGDEWLLFAGRTNTSKDNGGLHNMNANYANQSFPPPSFNKTLYVFNVSNNVVVDSISVLGMLEVVGLKYPKQLKSLTKNIAVFQNTNAQVKQVGDFLYVVGGYGPKDIVNPTKEFITYNQVAKIHVPSLIGLIKKDYKDVKEDKLFVFGKNKNLIATGGEMIQTTGIFGNAINLVMGHNFTNANQKYQDAIYPFSIVEEDSVTVSTPITDVINPKVQVADDLSNFRRRDGPVLPALFKNPVNGQIQQGISIYGGVFKPGNVLQAWNDAIYIHPDWSNNEGRYFTEDKKYNQNNYNVYSCPNFVVYDPSTDTTHSFLMGGIGNGSYSSNGNLSGFTNTAVHIQTNIGKFPLRSSHELIQSTNLFTKKDTNEAPFYGAEAIFFPSQSLVNVMVNNPQGAGETITEVIDMSLFEDGDINVGYIFGGIEAFEANPASYGPRKSRASNKIWKVILKKK